MYTLCTLDLSAPNVQLSVVGVARGESSSTLSEGRESPTVGVETRSLFLGVARISLIPAFRFLNHASRRQRVLYSKTEFRGQCRNQVDQNQAQFPADHTCRGTA